MTTGQSLKPSFCKGKLISTKAAGTGGRGSADTNLTQETAGLFLRTNTYSLYNPCPSRLRQDYLVHPPALSPQTIPAPFRTSGNSPGRKSSRHCYYHNLQSQHQKETHYWTTHMNRGGRERGKAPSRGTRPFSCQSPAVFLCHSHKTAKHSTSASWSGQLPQLTCTIPSSTANPSKGMGKAIQVLLFERLMAYHICQDGKV